MANITVNGPVADGDFLVRGTTGDDMVTYNGSIIATGATSNVNNGAGGSDTATLMRDGVADLATAGLTFGAVPGWLTPGTATSDTFGNSFVSLTTSEGVTLVGGTAATGTANPTAATVADPLDGSYSADPTTAYNYNWTGAALTGAAAAGTYFVKMVDGRDVTTGTTIATADGKGSITVVDADLTLIGAGTADVEFTPNTTALAAGNNIGDMVSFTYDVVLENAVGGQITVQQTFTVTVDWTNGADTAQGTTASEQIIDGGNITDFGPNGVLGGGDDTITHTTVSGLAGGNDTIDGGAGNDMVIGGAGSNRLIGGSGNDTVTSTSTLITEMNYLGGGAGNDVLSAGSIAGGADTLFGAGGNDTMAGALGNDTLNGSGGDDTMSAPAGNNFFRGGEGDDTMTGGAGNDTFKGGAGADAVAVTGGNNTVFTSAGEGDTINLTGGLLDNVVMKNGTGTTTVTAFGAAAGDSVDVSALGYTTFADVLANAYQTDIDATGTVSTVILGADSSLVLNGVTLTSLVDANFDYA